MAIKQFETAGAPADRGRTDLSIIGVPDSQLGRLPGVAGYPKKFNPEAQKVWNKMVQNEDFKKRCKQAVDLDVAWHNAIQEFLRLCEEVGVFPFVNNADTSRNEFIQDYVRRARMALVKFFDENCIFERVKVRKAYRDYFRKDTGLVINSWAELYPVKDTAEFMSWIQKAPAPRFIKHTDNHYVKVIQPNVRAWVKFIHSGRIVIGFSIEVVGTITVPNKPNPKRKEVDKFIDDRIFLPTIRAHRFKGVTTRLF